MIRSRVERSRKTLKYHFLTREKFHFLHSSFHHTMRMYAQEKLHVKVSFLNEMGEEKKSHKAMEFFNSLTRYGAVL